eukprot:GEMP01116608.1.p1 GENE.GEMP01116608.1~~GEMP01116608.1.p1  ORF type:complete len:177 (+),score=40.87 GEMP01116608.1:48-533(+)
MPHCYGFRARTRDKFSKAFNTKGMASVSRLLTPFKRGDYVDIKVDASQQKGMPYNFYHGRTGVCFNVNKNAIGVEVTKNVGNRQLRKRLHVRIEHVRRSRCNDDFLRRVKLNDKIKQQAKLDGKKVSTKRVPILPKPGKTVRAKNAEQEVFAPLPFIANYF